MKIKLKILATISLFIGVFILLIYFSLLILNGHIDLSKSFSLEISSKVAPFIGSCVGIFFSLSGTLFIFENLRMTNDNNQKNQILTQKNQFESVFFNLLIQQRQIKDTASKCKVHFTEEEIDLESVEPNLFENIAIRIKIDFDKNPLKSQEELIKVYNKWFNIYNSDLGHYFRHLYHIIKFVHKNPYFNLVINDINSLQREDYIKILRAQLSNAELILIGINGLTKQGHNFKKYIDDYNLLININLELELPLEYLSRIPEPQILIDAYPQLKDHL